MGKFLFKEPTQTSVADYIPELLPAGHKPKHIMFTAWQPGVAFASFSNFLMPNQDTFSPSN